jgi:hypothetical protein
MNTIDKIEKLHGELEASIFTINPVFSYDGLAGKFIELCELIEDVEETGEWCYIGEWGSCELSSMIEGAFWHYTEWHGGQASIGYAAYCALSGIFSPGMGCGPEEESVEMDCYNYLNEMAEGE